MNAPKGFCSPLRAVQLSGKPLTEVLCFAVIIDGEKYVDEEWAACAGRAATARERAGIVNARIDASAAPTTNVIALASRSEKQDRFLNPCPVIFCIENGERVPYLKVDA